MSVIICYKLSMFIYNFNLPLDYFKAHKALIDTWQNSLRFKEEIILTRSYMTSLLMSTAQAIWQLEETGNKIDLEFKQTYSENLRSLRANGFIIKEEICVLNSYLTNSKNPFASLDQEDLNTDIIYKDILHWIQIDLYWN